MHDKFGLYAGLFMLKNVLYIYNGNRPLAVLPMSVYSEIIYIEFLDLCVVLRFTSLVKLVLNLQLLIYSKVLSVPAKVLISYYILPI